MSLLQSLERWCARAFLVGSAMFVVAAATSVVRIVTGMEDVSLHLGEAFIAAGWFAALVGLLGLYRGLADRNRWLIRAGSVFATIGLVAFAVLAVVSLVVFFGGGSIEALIHPALMLVGVLVGSLLAFVSFGGASLRSDTHSRTVGLLLLVPPLIFVTNFFILPLVAGPAPTRPVIGFIIVSALALTMAAIGYSLRTSERSVNQTPTADTTA